MVACRYWVVLRVFNSTSHLFIALTRELSSWTLEEKFHISLALLMRNNQFIMWIRPAKWNLLAIQLISLEKREERIQKQTTVSSIQSPWFRTKNRCVIYGKLVTRYRHRTRHTQKDSPLFLPLFQIIFSSSKSPSEIYLILDINQWYFK